MKVKHMVTIEHLLNSTWSGGYVTVDTIIEHDKGQELLYLLADVFSGGVPTITEVNDFLWFDREWIFEQLDIEF